MTFAHMLAALSLVEVSGSRGNNKYPWNNYLFKGFCCFPVSRYFWVRKVSRNRRSDKIPLNNDFFSRDFIVFLFLDTFEFKKYLETGKWQNPLLEQNRPEQGGTERPGKCLETGKWQNSLLEQNRPEQGGTERPFRCLDFLSERTTRSHPPGHVHVVMSCCFLFPFGLSSQLNCSFPFQLYTISIQMPFQLLRKRFYEI